MPSMSDARLARLLGGLHDLDPAGLAAAARVNLRLHHDGAADVPGGLLGFRRREREATGWNLDAVLAQQRLRLILVDVHGGVSPLRA